MKVTVRHFRVPPTMKKPKKKGKPDYISPYQRGVGFGSEFHGGSKPYERGGMTVCKIQVDDLEFKGVAICSMSDQFSYKKGYQIAKGRAEKVYQEYLEYINETV